MIAPKNFLAKLARQLQADRSGAVAVEFGLVMVPFVALSFAILETGLVFFAGQSLETSVERAARLIKTGQAQQQNMDAAAFKAAICNYADTFMACSAGLKVDVRTAATFDAVDLSRPMSGGNLDPSKFTYAPGKGGEIVVVRAFYEWPTLINLLGFNLANTANGTYLLSASDAFRNEPFPW